MCLSSWLIGLPPSIPWVKTIILRRWCYNWYERKEQKNAVLTCFSSKRKSLFGLEVNQSWLLTNPPKNHQRKVLQAKSTSSRADFHPSIHLHTMTQSSCTIALALGIGIVGGALLSNYSNSSSSSSQATHRPLHEQAEVEEESKF